MIAGVTGHQKRDGIDWNWVSTTVLSELTRNPVTQAVSSLAEGADQTFADAALTLRIPVLAVIPLDNYERFFSEHGRDVYRKMLARCQQISLHGTSTPEIAFLNAGRFIVDKCDLLLAIWDGEPAQGRGGTGDIVLYARERGRATLHIDPIERRVCLL